MRKKIMRNLTGNNSDQEYKGYVTYCCHLASIVSKFLDFNLRLWNYLANWNLNCNNFTTISWKNVSSITQFWSQCPIFFHLPAQEPNLEKNSIYSTNSFIIFTLSESSFTCPRLQASGLAWRLTKNNILKKINK
jgi:hypothetical protein